MPGITGIISKAQLEEKDVDQMIKSMIYESSYRYGKYVNKKLNLYIGWVCHSGSFTDCMPVWNETKDVCLIFSGEEFTDLSEISDLRKKGHVCDSENATYLVHLYEEVGPKFIDKLNGWFSGVLVDLRQEQIILFNDRYGLQRVYYYEKADNFYFSSEAKSLLKVLPELSQLDPQGFAETFSCGCVLQNRTIFSKILLLPSGSRWMFGKNRDIRKERYLDPQAFEKKPLLGEIEYYDELKKTFSRILPRYFRGKQQVGMSLTGGLDGRLIMAWGSFRPEELPCFTFNGSYHDCIDVKIARQIAKLCCQSHKTISVDSQFYLDFPKLAEKAVFISDGTMDVTGSVELYVNKIARSIAAVRLTGNYGSEILRGNIAFRPSRLDKGMLQPEFATLVRDAANTYDSEFQGHRQSFIAFKQVPWHHYSRLSIEQSQITIRSPYLDNDLVSLTFQGSPDIILSERPSLQLIAEASDSIAKIPTDRGLLYRKTLLRGKIEHAFMEFTFRAEYAYDYGMPHWMAKIDQILTPLHFEKLFLGRHKFAHFRIWYRDKLSKYVKEILLDSRTLRRPYLNGRFLENMVNSHIKGFRNYTLEIHRALTSELTHRQFVEQ